MENNPTNKSRPVSGTRRELIKTSLLVSSAIVLPTIFTRSADAYTNEPNGAEVVFGINVPQTGAYADKGMDELRGFELAIEHINGDGDNGMLNTMKPLSLKGNGVNGKKVVFVTGDTQTKADAARASAKSMIEKDGTVMITGGISNSVAIAVQELCQQAGIIFMVGQAQSSRFTSPYAFRHFLNAEMSGIALVDFLATKYGKNRSVFQVTPNYYGGDALEEIYTQNAMRNGWQIAGSVQSDMGNANFDYILNKFLDSRADVIILNQYGSDLQNSLAQLSQIKSRRNTIGGNEAIIVAPFLTRSTAIENFEHIDGVFGTVNWDWSLQDDGSNAFTRSFGQKYRYPPSQSAHMSYCQTVLYADAAQRAGTFHPEEVSKALEGNKFQGLGTGPSYFHENEHQCIKDVFVVQGKGRGDSKYDLFEVSSIVSNLCPVCGTNGPETCSKNACAQGYQCCNGVCKKNC